MESNILLHENTIGEPHVAKRILEREIRQVAAHEFRRGDHNISITPRLSSTCDDPYCGKSSRGFYDARRIFNPHVHDFGPSIQDYETSTPRVRTEIVIADHLAGKATDKTFTARDCLPGPSIVDPGVPKYLLQPLDPPHRKSAADSFPKPTYTFSDIRALYDDSNWIDETIAGQCRRVGGGGALTLPSSVRDPESLLRRDRFNLNRTGGLNAFFKDDKLPLSETVSSVETLSNRLGFKVFETPRGEGKAQPLGSRRRAELVYYLKNIQPPLASGDALTRSNTPGFGVAYRSRMESLRSNGALFNLSSVNNEDEIQAAMDQSTKVYPTRGGLPIRPAGPSEHMVGIRDHPFKPFDPNHSWMGAAGEISSDLITERKRLVNLLHVDEDVNSGCGGDAGITKTARESQFGEISRESHGRVSQNESMCSHHVAISPHSISQLASKGVGIASVSPRVAKLLTNTILDVSPLRTQSTTFSASRTSPVYLPSVTTNNSDGKALFSTLGSPRTANSMQTPVRTQLVPNLVLPSTATNNQYDSSENLTDVILKSPRPQFSSPLRHHFSLSPNARSLGKSRNMKLDILGRDELSAQRGGVVDVLLSPRDAAVRTCGFADHMSSYNQ